MWNVGGSSSSGVLSRIDGLRLILESTPSDDELSKRLEGMGKEIEAMEQAILGNGSYLGIPEEDKLKKRLATLKESRDLVDDERALLEQIRAALADEERKDAEQEEGTLTESRDWNAADNNSASKAAPAQPSKTGGVSDKNNIGSGIATSGVASTPFSKPLSPSLIPGGFLPSQTKAAAIGEFLRKKAARNPLATEANSISKSPAPSAPALTSTANAKKRPIPFTVEEEGGDDMDNERPQQRQKQ